MGRTLRMIIGALLMVGLLSPSGLIQSPASASSEAYAAWLTPRSPFKCAMAKLLVLRISRVFGADSSATSRAERRASRVCGTPPNSEPLTGLWSVANGSVRVRVESGSIFGFVETPFTCNGICTHPVGEPFWFVMGKQDNQYTVVQKQFNDATCAEGFGTVALLTLEGSERSATLTHCVGTDCVTLQRLP